MWPDLLAAAVDETARVVLLGEGADWSVPAGRLEWSCLATVAHLAGDFVGYAGQLTAPREYGYAPFDVVLDDEPDVAGLADVMRATGGMLGAAARTVPRSTLSWHPYGMAGPDDFCAMGVVEALVHTHDIAQGIGVEWNPPSALPAAVIARLFVDEPAGGDPWTTLLTLTGRVPDQDGAFRTKWRWHNTGA